MRGNNAIACSFNDNFLVRLSGGRHSSPETVASSDEMHGTNERPDAPVKTGSVDSLGNHDGKDRDSGIGMCIVNIFVHTRVLNNTQSQLKS